MRIYADLHLCPLLDDVANAHSMAGILKEIQTGIVGLVIAPDRLSPTPPALSSFRDLGIDVARRLNLKPRSREELLRSLRKLRSKYEIIAVECTTPSVSRVAVRDKRVDIVRFPKKRSGSTFRRNLASTCRAALEIDMSELTQSLEFETRLHGLRRQIEIAAETSTRVIGSTNASNSFGLRAPKDVAAILEMLGLPPEAALKSVSETPVAIVNENRLRIGDPQVDEGVKIIKRSTNNE